MGRKAKNVKEKAAAGLLNAPRGAGRDTDTSDLESIYSSVQGDYQASIVDDEEFDENAYGGDAFGDLMDLVMDKNIVIRQRALEDLCRYVRHSYVPDVLEKYKQTLCDQAEKNIRRTADESLCGMRLSSLLSLQFGLDIEDVFDSTLNSLCALFADASQAESLRATCCEVLGISAYFGIYRPVKRNECLNALKQIWWGMRPAAVQPQLFSAALMAWALLLERCESAQVEDAVENAQPRLCTFLGSTSVDVRVATGSALAILHELAVQELDDEFRFANHAHLKSVFDEMSVDSAKYHGKKDKRLQKFTFRQIIDAIFNGNAPTSQVRFNKRESLDVEGCHSKLLYDCLCHTLKGDINTHLTKNEVLREVFDLGPVLEAEEQTGPNKASKVERMKMLTASSKERNMRRGKQRDKKAF